MNKRAAGGPAEGEVMMHKARKEDFLTRWSSTERTPRINEKEFLADALQPFHNTIVKALAPHYHDVFEGENPADDPELIHYAIDLIHDAGRTFGTFIDDDPIATAIATCDLSVERGRGIRRQIQSISPAGAHAINAAARIPAAAARLRRNSVRRNCCHRRSATCV